MKNIPCQLLPFYLLLRLVLAQEVAQQQDDDQGVPSNCAAWSGAECSWEPNLRPMTVDFGPIKETFYAYVTPDVSTFYNQTEGTRTALVPDFQGMYGKFTNLSPQTLVVYWDPNTRGQSETYMADVEPFGSFGTATFPGHRFYATPQHQPDHVVQRWTVIKDTSLYYYDPYDSSSEKAQKQLQAHDFMLYQIQLQNRVFALQYRAFTGTDWLALYKHKQAPRFHMWRADGFGQTHVVETKEIQFVEQPDDNEIQRGMSLYGPRPDEIQRMRKYRDQHPTLTLTLKVLSCAPRVFEIPNFLSDIEIAHLLDIARKADLQRSTVSSGDAAGETSTTRTSRNNWIARHTDFMIDAVYKRAADVLQMNEALLRSRRKSEIPEFVESDITVSERLQLVHYDVGQQYTPHHDFAMPAMVNLQPSRFATILFYLNDDMSGGETSFPKWLNADTRAALKVCCGGIMR